MTDGAVFVESLQARGSGNESLETVSLAYGAFQQTVGNNSRFGWTKDG